MRLQKNLIVGVIILLSGACASTEYDPTKDWTPEQFYREAKQAMAAGNYETAINYYETLEARYPYGRYAEQAQLEIAYTYHKNDEPELAVAAADRFIRLHPTHPNADYAYYLKGLVHFNDRGSVIARWLGADSDVSDRDPRAAKEAYKAFKDLLERFPNSRYAQDAGGRLLYLVDSMAKHEIKVARFYYDRQAYVAAVNRTKYVLQNFQRTPSVEDALGIQAMAYKEMGLEQLMNDSLRVLRKNFPNSRYLKEVARSARTKG